MLAQKGATGLALFLVGLALEGSGYVANAAVQTPGALGAIRLMTGPIPAILLVAGIAFAALFPIERAAHLRVREELAKRRGTDKI